MLAGAAPPHPQAWVAIVGQLISCQVLHDGAMGALLHAQRAARTLRADGWSVIGGWASCLCSYWSIIHIHTNTSRHGGRHGRTTKRLVCGARCVRASRWQHAQTRQLSRFRCIPGLSWELRQCAMDSLDSSVGLCGGARMQTGFARCWRHSQTPRRSS